jgi:glycosyltransferase involved in cell wall biosynthesis
MTIDGATANNALLEAMACGLPVVSENVGGIAEYTGPSAAVLCPMGDIAGLEKAVLELQRQPDMTIAMGRSARRRALELDWPIVAQRTKVLYEQLMAVKHGATRPDRPETVSKR